MRELILQGGAVSNLEEANRNSKADIDVSNIFSYVYQRCELIIFHEFATVWAEQKKISGYSVITYLQSSLEKLSPVSVLYFSKRKTLFVLAFPLLGLIGMLQNSYFTRGR